MISYDIDTDTALDFCLIVCNLFIYIYTNHCYTILYHIISTVHDLYNLYMPIAGSRCFARIHLPGP